MSGLDAMVEKMKAEIKSKCGGKLRIRFVGIDGWDRPIFKDDRLPNSFFGDTGRLFSADNPKAAILNCYEGHPHLDHIITYFGSSFGCEPLGLPLTGLDIEFVGD